MRYGLSHSGIKNEYRTGLIADMVTGKLDVREATAELADEPDESEPPDDDEILNTQEGMAEKTEH